MRPKSVIFAGLLSVVAVTASGAATEAESTYIDKNKYFQFIPPQGWIKKEFDDPRTKVEFAVPGPISGRNKASLFFLIHPLSGSVDVRTEAEDRVARLEQMGATDAKATTVDFAGARAQEVSGALPRQNTRMKVLMFTNHNRSYVISFTATTQDFAQYVAIAESALRTFKCLPPEGQTTKEETTPADAEKILKEKIRVWVNVLKESDIGTDAEKSLVSIGEPAVSALEDAQRTGTPLQRERAAKILDQIKRTLDETVTIVAINRGEYELNLMVGSKIKKDLKPGEQTELQVEKGIHALSLGSFAKDGEYVAGITGQINFINVDKAERWSFHLMQQGTSKTWTRIVEGE